MQNTVKKDPSRSGQTSLAGAGNNFTKPRTKIKFGPSIWREQCTRFAMQGSQGQCARVTHFVHNYALEPILLLSPGQLHTHGTCTYGHGGAQGRPHDHRARFGIVKIFKNFLLYFWNLHIMIRGKMQKKNFKNFCPAKVTPAGT